MPPGEEVAVYEEGVPPLAAAVKGTDAVTFVIVTVPIVGASSTSTIFDAPAEASLYFLPVKFESDAFLVAIRKSHFRTQKMTCLPKTQIR